MFADEYFEDLAVDAVVGPVQSDDLDLGALLAEPVDPAFALVVACRVPGQVVVDDRVEVVLEVDASERQSVAIRTRRASGSSPALVARASMRCRRCCGESVPVTA